jgi:hypothetical protein
MSDFRERSRCRGRTLFSIGLSVGVVIGVVLGSAVALRLGSEAIDTMRSLIDRVSGRDDQVNFELLLQ